MLSRVWIDPKIDIFVPAKDTENSSGLISTAFINFIVSVHSVLSSVFLSHVKYPEQYIFIFII